MERTISHGAAFRSLAPAGAVALLVGVAIGMIFLYAPTEASMGEVQRILYLHVAVAWCGLTGFVASAVCGIVFLARRRLAWDHTAQAAAEVGWLCTTLTLVTGSLWAHEAWNTWWTWEPRLTSSLVLWLIYTGVFLVRSGIEDPIRRARTCALITILGASDIPLILMATRWFRGVHPVTPEMDPRMRVVLLAAAISFTAFFVYLTLVRRRQLATLERIESLEAELDLA